MTPASPSPKAKRKRRRRRRSRVIVVVKRRVVVRRVVVKQTAPAIQRYRYVSNGDALVLIGLGLIGGAFLGSTFSTPRSPGDTLDGTSPYPRWTDPPAYGPAPPEARTGRRSALDSLIAFFTDLWAAVEKKPADVAPVPPKPGCAP